MEKTRRCRICGEDKEISEFYPTYAKNGGVRRVCKKCFLEQNKKYQEAHREKKLAYLREYHQSHKARARETSRKMQKHRLIADPVYKAKRHARLALWRAFKEGEYVSTETIRYWTGCSASELVAHLKQTWKDKYGTEWSGQPYNVDHIIPLLTAETESEVRQLCHYTNLRLITPEDNFNKGLDERRNSE